MGVNILKKKERLDGHKVYLCKFPRNEFQWIIVHVDPDGHIADSTCYVWGPDSKIKKKVQQEAQRTYHIWCQILMLRIDDYEIGPTQFRT